MTARATVDTLRDYLARGVTGCLGPADADLAGHAVYVMQGEILAAHGPDDGIWLIRRLVNNGALSQHQGGQLEAAVHEGHRFEELLLGRVPDELFLDLLTARFRQDLLDFLRLDASLRFESMDAIFVDNIQVGHDSIALLDELISLGAQTAELRQHGTGHMVRPGPAMPTRLDEARLLDLCETPLLLADLLDLSPYEPDHTLSIVKGMLEIGGLVAEAPRAEPEPDPEPEATPDPEPPADEPAEPEAPPEPVDDEPAQVTSSAEELGTEPPSLELDDADLEPIGPDDLLEAATEVSAPVDAGSLELDTADYGDTEDEPSEAPTLPEVPDDELLAADTVQQALDEGEDDVSLTPPLDEDDDFTQDTWDEEADVTTPHPLEPPPEEALAEDDGEDPGDAIADLFDEVDPDGETIDDSLNNAQVEAAIERARRIEARRAAARKHAEESDEGVATHPPMREDTEPTGDEVDYGHHGPEQDLPPTALEIFLEREDARDSGQGIFTLKKDLLDFVDLSPAGIQETMSQVDAEYSDSEIVELGDAENLSEEEKAGIVSLNLEGPRLQAADVELKVSVASDVLQAVAAAYDAHQGRGAGMATTQLLVEGAPARYAVLFVGIEVGRKGSIDADDILGNLQRRPESEHRRLLNEALLNLIQRALATSVEELPEEAIEPLLQAIAGYQQRLGR